MHREGPDREEELERIVAEFMMESGLTSMCILTREGACMMKDRTGKPPSQDAWAAIKAAMNRCGVRSVIAALTDDGVIVDWSRSSWPSYRSTIPDR